MPAGDRVKAIDSIPDGPKSRTARARAARLEAAPASIEPLLVDEFQGAALCGVGYGTFREFVQAGLIPTVALPSVLNTRRALKRKLIDRRDIERFIETHKTGGAR